MLCLKLYVPSSFLNSHIYLSFYVKAFLYRFCFLFCQLYISCQRAADLSMPVRLFLAFYACGQKVVFICNEFACSKEVVSATTLCFHLR